MNDYDRSVDVCLGRLLQTVSPSFSQKVDIGLYSLLHRVRLAMPAVTPCEVLALIDANAEHHSARRMYSMVILALLRRGWDYKQSAQFYTNFRNKLRKPFNLQLARLLTREQLHEVYTTTYGDVIADMLVDPLSNPVLHAMLYDNVLKPIKVGYQTVAIPVVFDERDFVDDLKTVAIPALSSRQLNGHNLDYITANRLYGHIAGGSLQAEVNYDNSHGYDYERTPEAKEAVRKTYSP